MRKNAGSISPSRVTADLSDKIGAPQESAKEQAIYGDFTADDFAETIDHRPLINMENNWNGLVKTVSEKNVQIATLTDLLETAITQIKVVAAQGTMLAESSADFRVSAEEKIQELSTELTASTEANKSLQAENAKLVALLAAATTQTQAAQSQVAEMKEKLTSLTYAVSVLGYGMASGLYSTVTSVASTAATTAKTGFSKFAGLSLLCSRKPAKPVTNVEESVVPRSPSPKPGYTSP